MLQMLAYYIYNKYFVNKVTTLCLYKKSFINNNMVNKLKCIYWFIYKIVIGSQNKEKQVNVNFNLIERNSLWISYNQYIQKKIKHKLCMKPINYACFKLEEKITRSVKKNKSNFINIIGDKFAMSIRWVKLKINNLIL